MTAVLTSFTLNRSQRKLIGSGFKGKTDLHQLFQSTVTQPEQICKSGIYKVKLKLTKMQRQYSIPLRIWMICMAMFCLLWQLKENLP